MVKDKSFFFLFCFGILFLFIIFFWACNFSPAYALPPASSEPEVIENALSITSSDSVVSNIQAIRGNFDFVLFILFPLSLAVFAICKAAHWFYCAFVKGFL